MAGADHRLGRRRALVAAVPVVALLLTACAGAADRGAAAQASPAAEQETDAAPSTGIGTVQSVDCPGSARAVDLPPGFPAPLPEGTVVVDVRGPENGRTVVTGVVPHAEQDVLADLQRAYPAAGMTLTEGETEERDAESNFTGAGVTGRWGIRELSDCAPAATRVDVVVRR